MKIFAVNIVHQNICFDLAHFSIIVALSQQKIMKTPGITNQAPETPAYSRDYCIYKPNSRGTGSALQFNLNPAKGSLFVEAANQVAEKQFDWENKVIMKWNLDDIGMILAVLTGRQVSAKLFHQSERSNSVFELNYRNEPERAPYFATLSRKLLDDQSLSKVSLPIGEGEAAILSTLLQRAVVGILRW